MDLYKECLATSELFQGLSAEELDKVARICVEEPAEVGETIFNEGNKAKNLYIVEEGRVVLEMTIRLGHGSERQGIIEVVSKGGSFGWSAVVEPHDLTMSARSTEKNKLIALDGAELCRLFKENPKIGYKVMQKLAGTLRSRVQHTGNMLTHVLSVASHDLKAPLAAVESYHQVILGGFAGETTEKQRTMLVRSSERIKELLNLIDNILDISRIDAKVLKMENMNLLELLETTKDIIQPLAEKKGITFEVEAPETLPLILGAHDRLQQVFTNLLGNAVKFTPEGKTITLRMSEKDDHVLVEVIDTGIGISPDELPRIFDEFYRGIKVSTSGAGLGLAISKKIIEAHDGNIWVESPCPETGTGSKFTFTLPKNTTT